MKIAVVCSGISGLSAAYYLSKKHHVDLFEKEDRFGGHSHTIDLLFGTKKVPVDIGFIVFNYATYPNLINFYKKCDNIKKIDQETTLGDYLRKENLSKEFINFHLIPMVSAYGQCHQVLPVKCR